MDEQHPFFDRLYLWHDPEPHSGSWNMAVDQAWLELTDAPLLRIYSWDRATITIGYAQNLAKLRDQLPEWPIIRRWTGGGVVYHNGDLTYSLIVPSAHGWAETRPVDSYRMIHGSLAAALVQSGIPGARLAEQEDIVEAPFCFVAPALHDVISGPSKLAGAGQRRSKIGLLHQGSIQQVKVGATFWSDWASALAQEIAIVPKLPDIVRERAVELDEKRYQLPEWLDSRDDALPRRR